MKPPFMRTPYNYDRNKVSKETGLQCTDPTLTQQHFKEEADINTLVERFGITGEMPQVINPPAYGDYTGVFDFQTAQNAVIQARDAFMQLPAKIRARFHNNPQEYHDFFLDEENRPEAERLGLLKPKPPTPLPGDPAASNHGLHTQPGTHSQGLPTPPAPAAPPKGGTT